MIPNMINRLVGERSSNRFFIAAQTSGLYALRIFYKVINFASAVMLARWLGHTSFGVYTLAFAWAGMLVTPALLGMERLGIREVSQAHIEENWGRIKGFLFWSFSRAFAASLVTGCAMAGVSFWVYADDLPVRNAFITASILIPVTALVRRLQSTHDGLKNMTQGRLPDMLIQPLTFVAGVAFVYWKYTAWLNAASVLGIYVVTMLFFSLGLTSWLLRRVMPREVWEALPVSDAGVWRNSTLVFLLISIMFVVDSRVSTLLLGALSSKSEVATYGVITRVVDLLTFVLISFAAPVSRVGMQYIQQAQHIRLQRLLTRTARTITLIGWPLGILLIIFGRWYLLIFGPEYLPGYPALVLLTIAEMVNVATGISGYLLMVTKHEKINATVVTSAFTLNIALGWLLIPRLGVTGAAIAEMSSVIIRNLVISFMTWKVMKINPTILGSMPAVVAADVMEEN